MKAFLKTLFGDAGTVTVVALIMAAEVFLSVVGQPAVGAVLIPAAVLVGVARLALR
ncbi:MAG TPA: hypothetical protein VNW53_04150 [Phenylobacterium sp.]|jgi:hypothetical protein|uniref:hypothetical protein n=1 Tax=Phenylobacterium sp. TaxID=1871053 RepID=UPI002BBA77DA|nr:hypothetical protein [Phenylobacterium sp.]HXA38168.1 hypothetical protein [Phenylobacterium sp.]